MRSERHVKASVIGTGIDGDSGYLFPLSTVPFRHASSPRVPCATTGPADSVSASSTSATASATGGRP